MNRQKQGLSRNRFNNFDKDERSQAVATSSQHSISIRPFTTVTGMNKKYGKYNELSIGRSDLSTRLPVVSSTFDAAASHTQRGRASFSSVVAPNSKQRKNPNVKIVRKPTTVTHILKTRKQPSDAVVTDNYTILPVVPADKKELIAVAKAMHRESFAPRVKTLFQPETDAAVEAINSGIYIGFRCPEFTWDCIRLGSSSRCFCDHILQEHESYNGKKVHVKCNVNGCKCRSFQFIPQRPEDIGEWWHQKRPGFDVSTWRAKCRCKHSHVEHDPISRKCHSRQCGCFIFTSNFLCAACDRHWEEHETFFDNVSSRKEKGLPYGEEYIPFHELPDIKNMCLTGSEVMTSSNIVSRGGYRK